MGDELVTNTNPRSPETDPNVRPSPPLEAERVSAITPRSNVTPIDGIPTRNGLPVLDKAPSNTDTDHASEPVHETVLVSFRLPRLSVIEVLRDRGFLGDADSDEDITRAVLGMLAAAWKADIRAAERATEVEA
jgi:hypothetical protein